MRVLSAARSGSAAAARQVGGCPRLQAPEERQQQLPPATIGIPGTNSQWGLAPARVGDKVEDAGQGRRLLLLRGLVGRLWGKVACKACSN
jgi:hypothetical protein